MRVLLLTDSEAFAGTERHILELAQGLRRRGVAVHIGCPAGTPLARRAAEDPEGAIPVVPIEKGPAIDLPAIRILHRLLRQGQIDVVHAHNGRAGLCAAVATALAHRGSCVFTQHFIEPTRVGRRGLKAWLSARAYRWINRHIHRFIAISRAVKTSILERGEAPEERIAVVPNGITPPDPAQLALPAKMRAALGLSERAPLILCVARLAKEKDAASLVEAMATVVRTLPEAVCILAGEGEERAALEAQIGRLGLAQNVRLAGFCEDPLSLIHAADLFVLPSLAEPFGLVLLEAMALGKAVIATDAGGPKEIVTPATGRLVPPRDPAALAAAILLLLRDPVLRQSMGEAARRRFEEQFTTGRMAAQTLSAYELVNSPVCASC